MPHSILAPNVSAEQSQASLDRVLAGTAMMWLFALLAVVSMNSAAAQSLAPQIAEAALESASQLNPNAIVDVEPTQAEFLAAVDQLRSHLAATTTKENAQAWIKYLQIDPAADAIAAGDDESTIASDTTRILYRATGIHPGLEVPAIRRVRSAAERYADALQFRRKEKTTELLEQLLQRSAQEWTEIKSNPSPDEIATLRTLLNLLERTNQSVALVDRSKSLFASTNLHVTINESLVRRAASRAVDQCSKVNDCILGTRIVGDAHLTGDVTTTLLPSTGSVRLQIALNAQVSTLNKGYNGPVRLRTSGNGYAYATRTVQVSESGIQFDPVVASGAMQTQINAIEHPLGLVRRIAKKKAAQQKPIADRIANQKFISRISDEFSKETDGAVTTPMPDLMGQARPYLQRLDMPEPARLIGSTSHSVFVSATIRKGNQLAAPTPPPMIPSANDATFQIHESVIDNTIGALLAGRTVTRTELQQMASKLKRPGVDDEDTIGDEDAEEEPEFEIDFHSSRPIIFEARDGKLRVGIQGTRFAQGSRELKRKLEIVANYEPVTIDSGQIVLRRIGEVEINFPGTTRLSVGQAGLRGSIKKGFADAFPETLLDKPWVIPADAQAKALRGLQFRPRYFDAQDGWLTLGIRT